MHLLRTRGLLAVRIPKQPVLDAPRVVWIMPLAVGFHQRQVWVVDGSLIHARLPGCAATGAAAVVVNADGSLAGIAQILLPTKVRTAAAAELEALAVVLQLSPFTPNVVTDCLSIVTAAGNGAVKAGSGMGRACWCVG